MALRLVIGLTARSLIRATIGAVIMHFLIHALLFVVAHY